MDDNDAQANPVPPTETAICNALLALLAARVDGASICPSEVARHLTGDAGPWRLLMPAVREAARALVLEGRVQVTQRGSPLSAHTPWVGPIRIRYPR